MRISSSAVDDSLDFAHRQAGAHGESHGIVKPARRQIALAHVQKGANPAPALPSQERTCEPACMTSARKIRVSANATDLLQPVQSHAFAGHCDQSVALVDAQIKGRVPRSVRERNREMRRGSVRAWQSCRSHPERCPHPRPRRGFHPWGTAAKCLIARSTASLRAGQRELRPRSTPGHPDPTRGRRSDPARRPRPGPRRRARSRADTTTGRTAGRPCPGAAPRVRTTPDCRVRKNLPAKRDGSPIPRCGELNGAASNRRRNADSIPRRRMLARQIRLQIVASVDQALPVAGRSLSSTPKPSQRAVRVAPGRTTCTRTAEALNSSGQRYVKRAHARSALPRDRHDKLRRYRFDSAMGRR